VGREERKQHSISVIIATAFREEQLVNALQSINAQIRPPKEVIIVDGAPAPGVEMLVNNTTEQFCCKVHYLRWTPPSAAVQRNAGSQKAKGDIILFMDDDAYLEVDCFEKMAQFFDDDNECKVGGIGVLISNQLCLPPSKRAKRWLDFLSDEKRDSYSGAVIGPGLNIGPEPTGHHQPVQVEWLSSTCTAYRREAFLPEKFCPTFYGYSVMEDVDISVRIARNWDIYVHTGAFIFHDSRPSVFKKPFIRAKMSVVNRYHVMTKSLGRRTLKHHLKFILSISVTTEI